MRHVHRITPGDLRRAAVDPIDDVITFRAKSMRVSALVKGGFELKTTCRGQILPKRYPLPPPPRPPASI